LVLGEGLLDGLGGVGGQSIDQVGECNGVVHRGDSACFFLCDKVVEED
jgi:hypothetical protein